MQPTRGDPFFYYYPFASGPLNEKSEETISSRFLPFIPHALIPQYDLFNKTRRKALVYNDYPKQSDRSAL